MARSLSTDLRLRVVEAISQGMSRRQAAGRFGVSPSSAIRWQAQLQRSGGIAPNKQGGDRRSARIEAEAGFILAEIAKTPDITLAELQAKLEEERGLHAGIGTIWRFFHRRRITFKKNRTRRRTAAG